MANIESTVGDTFNFFQIFNAHNIKNCLLSFSSPCQLCVIYYRNCCYVCLAATYHCHNPSIFIYLYFCFSFYSRLTFHMSNLFTLRFLCLLTDLTRLATLVHNSISTPLRLIAIADTNSISYICSIYVHIYYINIR